MPSFSIVRKDVIIILALLLISSAWFVYGISRKALEPEALYAEIMYEGSVVLRVSLNEERVFSVDGLPNVVFEVKDNKIAFVTSDCPDKVCIKSGWLNAGGQNAACLPNRVVLFVVDVHTADKHAEERVDAVAK